MRKYVVLIAFCDQSSETRKICDDGYDMIEDSACKSVGVQDIVGNKEVYNVPENVTEKQFREVMQCCSWKEEECRKGKK